MDINHVILEILPRVAYFVFMGYLGHRIAHIVTHERINKYSAQNSPKAIDIGMGTATVLRNSVGGLYAVLPTGDSLSAVAYPDELIPLGTASAVTFPDESEPSARRCRYCGQPQGGDFCGHCGAPA